MENLNSSNLDKLNWQLSDVQDISEKRLSKIKDELVDKTIKSTVSSTISTVKEYISHIFDPINKIAETFRKSPVLLTATSVACFVLIPPVVNVFIGIGDVFLIKGFLKNLFSLSKKLSQTLVAKITKSKSQDEIKEMWNECKKLAGKIKNNLLITSGLAVALHLTGIFVLLNICASVNLATKGINSFYDVKDSMSIDALKVCVKVTFDTLVEFTKNPQKFVEEKMYSKTQKELQETTKEMLEPTLSSPKKQTKDAQEPSEVVMQDVFKASVAFINSF